MIVQEVCGSCSGCGKIYENGLETDHKYEICPDCAGLGWIDLPQLEED